MHSLYKNFAAAIEKRFKIDASYFLSGGFWLTLGQGSSILFGLATTVLFAHFLSEANYGVYKYLIGISGILASFSLTGLGQSVLQTAAKQYYGFYKETLKLNFLYSLGITLAGTIGATYYWLNDNFTLATGCILIALLQPIINTYQYIPSFLQGSKRFKESTILHTVRMIIVSGISICTLFFTVNVVILFAAFLASYLVTNILSYLFFSTKESPVPDEILTRYIKYAKHTSLRNILSSIAQKADTIIIFTQLGAIELAIYSIANVVPEQIKGSLKNVSVLLLPKYAKHNNVEVLKKSVPKRSFQLFLILSIVSFAYIIVAPYVYGFIFPKYPDAVLYSQISALSFPFFILFIPYSILQSQLSEKLLYKLTLLSSVFQITVIILGTLYFGIMGAIIAKILHRIFFAIITYLFMLKI